MRLPYICTTLMAALSLASCSSASAFPSPGNIPTTLPHTTLADDKIGIAVETAYQAASLAERTAVKAGFVSPAQARTLINLDNQAYEAVCLTRTAYDVANGQDPSARQDGCSAASKANRYVGYVEAARMAVEMLKSLVSTTKGLQQDYLSR